MASRAPTRTDRTRPIVCLAIALVVILMSLMYVWLLIGRPALR
jgi:hypothetical protein